MASDKLLVLMIVDNARRHSKAALTSCAVRTLGYEAAVKQREG